MTKFRHFLGVKSSSPGSMQHMLGSQQRRITASINNLAPQNNIPGERNTFTSVRLFDSVLKTLNTRAFEMAQWIKNLLLKPDVSSVPRTHGGGGEWTASCLLTSTCALWYVHTWTCTHITHIHISIHTHYIKWKWNTGHSKGHKGSRRSMTNSLG